MPSHGKGSHGTLYLGEHGRTTVQDLKKELPSGTLNGICAQLFIAHSIAEKELIPPPSALKRGQRRLIAVPFWIAGKLAVYQAIQEAGITNVELAKRLGVTEAVVRRLLDPDHETKDRKLAAALAVLGKELVMAVVPRKVE